MICIDLALLREQVMRGPLPNGIGLALEAPPLPSPSPSERLADLSSIVNMQLSWPVDCACSFKQDELLRDGFE